MNNIIIGKNSGLDLKDEEGYVILGDNVSIQDVKEKTKDGYIFIGEKACIQADWLNDDCLLKQIYLGELKEKDI